MAVFTPVSADQACQLLAGYDLGALVDMQPIAQGVENTNYHIFTTKGRYILTLFEGRTDLNALPFFFDYTNHLRAAGVICPVALTDSAGRVLQNVAGKPAALISFLAGRGVEGAEITAEMVAEIGTLLARMHVAAMGFSDQRTNTVSLPYWHELADKCALRADDVFPNLSQILRDELSFLDSQWELFRALPQGVIHADLFPDNVFIDESSHVCGVIDFYFSARDVFLYDLAIVFNAWCFDAGNNLRADCAAALLNAYQAIRPLQAHEATWLNFALRAAAVRFLVSRLYDMLFQPAGALVTPKDPVEYLAKLQFHQRQGA